MNQFADSSINQSPTESTPCGLLRRIAAMTYDGLLLLALWMVATAIVIIPLDEAVTSGNALFQAYLLVVAWIYFAICWRKGQTLGMKAWRIQLASHQSSISWMTSVVRFLVALASLLCLGMGFFWSLFHPRKATWHDLASGTYLVIKSR
jgi:uncharacterized RDD family membrane protein YckC